MPLRSTLFRAACILAGALCVSPAAAIEGVNFGERAYDPMKSTGMVQALGPDAFGEAIDVSTGALSFSQMDLSVPGIGPAVSMARTFSVDGNKAQTLVNGTADQLWTGYSMGDWELELPWIGGTYAQASGWQVSTSSPNARC